MTVVADQGGAALWELYDLVLEIPKIPEGQPLEKHLENIGDIAALSRSAAV
jgi:hypothetical protein